MLPKDDHPLQGEMLQGTLDLLIVQSLVVGPAHGHMIAHVIEHGSEDVLQVEHGSLYPALHRLETRGWIEPVPTEDRRRPYRITGAGVGVLREQLATLQRVVATGQGRLFPA